MLSLPVGPTLGPATRIERSRAGDLCMADQAEALSTPEGAGPPKAVRLECIGGPINGRRIALWPVETVVPLKGGQYVREHPAGEQDDVLVWKASEHDAEGVDREREIPSAREARPKRKADGR
jgi:hypothetical protein